MLWCFFFLDKQRNENIKRYMEEVGVQLEDKILTDQDCLDQLKIFNMEKNRQIADKERVQRKILNKKLIDLKI